MINYFRRVLQYALVIGVLAILVITGFIYSGVYPMGADQRHNRLTYWMLETLRERSIARASQAIEVPDDLDSPDRLLEGGADYNDMCASCHLQPGRDESDLSMGLYPSPPNLTLVAAAGEEVARHRRNFWIIKHGIKASGMPAWGPGHSDDRIWSMVAFLKRLPDLSPVQYQILTARRADGSSHDH